MWATALAWTLAELSVAPEAQRMLSELRSRAPAVEADDDEDVRSQFSDELLPAVERVAADRRLLFVQVDT